MSIVGLPRWLRGKKIHLPVPPLGAEDLLEEEMATHPSILAWIIPWTEESGRLTVYGIAKSRTRMSD